MRTITLRNGVTMPIVGFGTYQISPHATRPRVEEALAVGYRAVDTAQCYGNERQVGQAIEASRLARKDIFVTTKTWTDGYRATADGIRRSVDLLGGYVDLLLIHEPTNDIAGTWQALEEAYRGGLARAIGISNFLGHHLETLLSLAEVPPAVDQVETHVFRQQATLQRRLAKQDMVLEAWSPLACGQSGIFSNPTLKAIAAAHGRSVAQVALRWLVQRDIPFNVKSTHADRMRENLDLFDFRLTEEDMDRIASLDTGKSQFGWW